MRLAEYIYRYLREEADRGNNVVTADMIQDALDAYAGGAR